jgi:hypothetical protein
MTKKQYLMLLWPLSCAPAIMSLVKYGWGSLFSFAGYGPLASFLIHPFFSIALHTCALFIGIYFAQQIGARLLFLQDNYDLKNDVLKPAVFMASLYAVAVLIINWVTPFGEIYFQPAYMDIVQSFFFYKIVPTMRFDLIFLLLGVCGSVFIIKKIVKNISLTVLMPICIVLISILPLLIILFDCVTRSRCLAEVLIRESFMSISCIILGMLFWKKGLEAALIYHVIVMTILYLIAPIVVLGLKIWG